MKHVACGIEEAGEIIIKKNPRTRDYSKAINNGLSLRVVNAKRAAETDGRTETVWIPPTIIRTVRTPPGIYTRVPCAETNDSRLIPRPPPAERKARFNGIEVSNPPELPKLRRPLITFTFRIAWLKNGALFV